MGFCLPRFFYSNHQKEGIISQEKIKLRNWAIIDLIGFHVELLENSTLDITNFIFITQMPQQLSYSDRHRSIWRKARTRYCCGAKPTQIRPRVLCGDELEDRKSQACRRVSSCDLLADVTVVFTLAKRKTLSAHPTPSPFSWTLNVTTDFFPKVFATAVINFSSPTQDPPRILSAGPDRLTTAPLFTPAAFECVAEGSPTPSYRWVQR